MNDASSLQQIIEGLCTARRALVFERRFLAGRTILLHHDERHDSARLEALLAIACQRRLSKRHLQSVNAAIDTSRRGDQSLANLRLAIAGLPRLPASSDCAVRISAAKALLANGCATTDLLRAAGHDLDDELAKFDPDQPRVPAGSGRESGRWTNGQQGGGAASGSIVLPAVAAVAERSAPLLAPTLGADAIAALSVFAGTVGFAATLGALFVPSPNNVSSSGPLPGSSGTSYSYNQDEGLLRVLDATGNVLAAGQKDKTGVFYDSDTGIPFARYLDGAILFDDDTVKTLAEDTTTAPRSAAKDDEDEEDDAPKLCPPPIPDKPGSEAASPRAQAYQEQISLMINPQRPLPYGLAMGLINPLTEKIIHYDECDEKTGAMIDAKGPGLAGILAFPQGKDSLTEDWLNQGSNQLAAAGSRNVIWYFAEDSAARYARDLFTSHGFGNIAARVQPAVWP